jgi:hypothetical protein
MATYLLTYHGGGMPETEEEQQRVLQAWTDWYGQIGAAVTDPGNPVGRSMSVNPDGSVTEGGGANPVSGYTLVTADSLDAAVDMAKGSPVLQSGGTVEIGETFEVM